MIWQDLLTDEERQALVFLRCYEQVRKESGQYGYKGIDLSKELGIRDDKNFNTALTVSSWIVSRGFEVTWKECHWIGFIKFCFQKLHPTIPMIGQLRNAILLRQYILSGHKPENREGLSEKDLEALYSRIIRPEIKSHSIIMRRLGLQDLTFCPQ